MYDRDGSPIDHMRWAELFGDREYARIAEDWHGQSRVSTVWMGMDHSFGRGPPLIFETMIFGGPLDGYQDRYSTVDEARAGHIEALAKVLALPTETDLRGH